MLVIQCPHCNDYVLITELNCKIFRHGVFIHNGNQIDPHSSKEKCDFFIANKQIYGCGKPFHLIKQGNSYVSEKCEYK